MKVITLDEDDTEESFRVGAVVGFAVVWLTGFAVGSMVGFPVIGFCVGCIVGMSVIGCSDGLSVSGF